MAARRTTLGPVSNSSLNSRMSIGWNNSNGKGGGLPGSAMKNRRASAAPAPFLGSGRRSSAAPGSIRRSSTFGSRLGGGGGGGGGTNSIVDPRPLSDKTFMASSVRNLICYLSEHGFDHAISPKLLSNPTSKDFQHILLFLLRQIDPSFTFQNRLEDDVRGAFKHLRYPFAISKSALHAVGSPHTWPALLGALNWLHELLTYDEEAEVKRVENEQVDVDAEGNRIFFDYLERTYESFLAGDDNFDDLDEELAQSFELKNRHVEEEIERLEAESTSLKVQVEKIQNAPSPLVTLASRKTDLEANVIKFKNLIEELEQYQAKMEDRVKEKQEEIAERENEIEAHVQELERLKEVIAQQESDAVDVQRIDRDRTTIRGAMQRLDEQRANAENLHKEADDAVVETTQRVTKALLRYHELADNLRLIPASAENANGVHFQASITRNASTTRAEDLLTVDMRAVVRPALIELKEAFVKIIVESQEEALSVQEQSDLLEEQVMVKTDEIQMLQTRLNKLEENYKSEKEALVDHLRSSSDNSIRLEEEIAMLKRENDEHLRASQKRVSNSSAELRDVRERLTQLRAEATANLLSSIDKLTNHKAHIQQSLAALKAHFEDSWADVLRPINP